MNVNCTAINPHNASIDLRGVHGMTVAHIRLIDDEALKVDVHDATDEQVTVAFDTGLVEKIQCVVNRNDQGHPFVSFTVVMPGVAVTYFWRCDAAPRTEEEAIDDFYDMLASQGYSHSKAKVEQMAGLA